MGESEDLDQSSQFGKLSKVFIENMNSLIIFVRRTGEFAKQHDIVSNQELKGLREKISKILEPENFETRSEETDDDARPIRQHLKLVDPEREQELIDLLYAVSALSPRQGFLLRRGALVLAISYFEVLLAQLIQLFFVEFPEALSEDLTIKFSEIRELSSIDELQVALIGKVAENVVREGTKAQLEYFKNFFKLNLRPIEEHIKSLSEISLRRNLVVHNDSIVNRFYLKSVDAKFAEDNKLEEGKRVPISQKYILRSIDTILLIGMYLLQSCWRKWKTGDLVRANSYLIDNVFKVLKAENYNFTIALARALSSVSMSLMTKLED